MDLSTSTEDALKRIGAGTQCASPDGVPYGTRYHGDRIGTDACRGRTTSAWAGGVGTHGLADHGGSGFDRQPLHTCGNGRTQREIRIRRDRLSRATVVLAGDINRCDVTVGPVSQRITPDGRNPRPGSPPPAPRRQTDPSRRGAVHDRVREPRPGPRRVSGPRCQPAPRACRGACAGHARALMAQFDSRHSTDPRHPDQ